MEQNDKIQLFEDKYIRTAWDNEKEEWYFSVVDVVAVLTDSPNPSNYWKVLKKRLKDEGNELVTTCNQLKLKSHKDGKRYLTDVADTEQLLRIIQSIPSPKAEPFKLWLAQVGRERIEETIDPELTIERALETYLKKGYTREWINQRLQAIQVRKELTDEWDARGVQKGVEYAILTDEISRAWSGMSTRQYKDFKGLKKENLSYNNLSAKFSAYQSRVEKNQALIQSKQTTPSMLIEIDPCGRLLSEINTIISEFNLRISENNNLVDNQKDTQKRCENEVWNFIATELSGTIQQYLKQLSGKLKAIENLNAKKGALEETAQNILEEIKEKRASVSNVQHTIQAINRILDGYGFTGFMLAENESVSGTYKIVRPDGSDAKPSLSEGEYNFITFLYFYHLILGSNRPEKLNKHKIIVIDDPISSLDSNVLFIVSSLVKNIISLCRNGEESIEQVIISTHNIYFHKEITFVGSRDHWPEIRTAFFIIRKKNQVSNITEYTTNQIQSSYEMLWDDIRNPNNGSAKSIFNTMRRILENYFSIIGGIDYETCINEFDGEDKLVCKSLISCINEQSHTISDDYFMCIADSEIDHYQRIFKEIFEKMNHLSHYKMMMRIED